MIDFIDEYEEFVPIKDSRGRYSVIVKFRDYVSPSLIANFGGETHAIHNFIRSATASIPPELIQELKNDPNVKYVEPNIMMKVLTTDNNMGQVPSYGINNIKASSVHSSGNKGTGVKIGIIDTGIDYNHEDLSLNYKGGHTYLYDSQGNLIRDDNDPMDDFGHGTHVSGIIAAQDNNVGVKGAAPEASLYMIKALDDTGHGYTSAFISGMEWLINAGVKIVSMSFGGPIYSQAFKDACDVAYQSNVLLIAAAGNSGIYSKCSGDDDTVGYPCGYDSVIAVSSLDMENIISDFSSSGPKVELAAPGRCIRSTVPSNGYISSLYGYLSLSGTSMACPFVAGVAALAIKANPTFTNSQIRNCLTSTATHLGSAGRNCCYGYGLVNAEAAIQCNILTLCPNFVCNLLITDALSQTQTINLDFSKISQNKLQELGNTDIFNPESIIFDYGNKGKIYFNNNYFDNHYSN